MARMLMLDGHECVWNILNEVLESEGDDVCKACTDDEGLPHGAHGPVAHCSPGAIRAEVRHHLRLTPQVHISHLSRFTYESMRLLSQRDFTFLSQPYT